LAKAAIPGRGRLDVGRPDKYERIMPNRSAFPPVFWVANVIELLERFAYYGIYFGFGIYMEYLGYTRGQLGIVQSIFLTLSYVIPVFSGTLADRYGFKRMLIVAYLAYLPAILLLLLTTSFSGIAVTMLTIGFAAGIFKPLISGTVRTTTDLTNKTLGFGIFYAIVNVGGSLGPIIAGKLREESWSYVFIASAIAIGVMMVITLLFYKEPERELDKRPLADKLREIGAVLGDLKFTAFLVLLGVFFWLPFWAFFNLCALYVDKNIDTAALYQSLRGVFGAGMADFFSAAGPDGTRRVLGETISHTGWIIMVFQIFVSRVSERYRAMPSFLSGLVLAALGFFVLGYARVGAPSLVFAGIALFAIGEMFASPRIQEYITWIAPKEKAGLYMGTNFLATCIGALLSGVTYTPLSGYFADAGNAEYVWYVMGVHTLLAVPAFALFTRVAGEFTTQDR
jgi:POT family proton-dependent oligopeptide transporter